MPLSASAGFIAERHRSCIEFGNPTHILGGRAPHCLFERTTMRDPNVPRHSSMIDAARRLDRLWADEERGEGAEADRRIIEAEREVDEAYGDGEYGPGND
jgi:hypothetical protein